MPSEALGRRLSVVIIAVLCISVVVFAAVYGQPTTDKGLGGGCEWDPDTWQVVCEPTAGLAGAAQRPSRTPRPRQSRAATYRRRWLGAVTGGWTRHRCRPGG